MALDALAMPKKQTKKEKEAEKAAELARASEEKRLAAERRLAEQERLAAEKVAEEERKAASMNGQANAASAIQARVRGKKVRDERRAEVKKQNDAAAKVQAHRRGSVARKERKEQNAAATKLQAVRRGQVARRAAAPRVEDTSYKGRRRGVAKGPVSPLSGRKRHGAMYEPPGGLPPSRAVLRGSASSATSPAHGSMPGFDPVSFFYATKTDNEASPSSGAMRSPTRATGRSPVRRLRYSESASSLVLERYPSGSGIPPPSWPKGLPPPIRVLKREKAERLRREIERAQKKADEALEAAREYRTQAQVAASSAGGAEFAFAKNMRRWEEREERNEKERTVQLENKAAWEATQKHWRERKRNVTSLVARARTPCLSFWRGLEPAEKTVFRDTSTPTVIPLHRVQASERARTESRGSPKSRLPEKGSHFTRRGSLVLGEADLFPQLEAHLLMEGGRVRSL